jgi:hypothetical protein
MIIPQSLTDIAGLVATATRVIGSSTSAETGADDGDLSDLSL